MSLCGSSMSRVIFKYDMLEIRQIGFLRAVMDVEGGGVLEEE